MTKLTQAEQKASSLTVENDSLRSTMGRQLQQLEEENNSLREQVSKQVKKESFLVGQLILVSTGISDGQNYALIVW